MRKALALLVRALRRNPILALATLVALATAPLFVVGEARAKASYDSAYTLEQTWNSALRLVRVDLGMKVLEKDDKAGYILFEYVDKGTTSAASLELLVQEKSIRVVCQIPKFPSYHEAVLLDHLARKLREENGTPPERPKPPVDAGSDGAGAD